MRKTVRERLQEAQQAEQQEQVVLTYDGLLERILGGPPNPTQKAFIDSPETYKAYMGAAGVAKTSTICAAGLLRALLEPGSKGLVARADYNDLKGVTKQRMEEMLARLPKGILLDRNKDAPETWWLRCADGEGVSQITFMGLNDEPMGHEFTWIAVDEAIEPEERHMRALRGRMRYMKGSRCMMLAFNPPDMNHWLYTACTGLDARGKKVQEPSFALFVPAADENIKNLPSGYYEELAKGMTEDMRERLVRGQWGAVFDTAPVYREFAPGIHVKRKIEFDTYSPLLRFWDFGYNHPVCLWAQIDDEGRIKVLHELMGDKEEIIPFARKVQGITVQKFKFAREVIDFGDPAARQKKDTGSTLTALGTVNITMIYSLTPSIEHGIQKVRMLLERLVRGEPAFQVAEDCMMLCRALRGGYRLDKSGQKPLKDDVYDHCADALRYGIENLVDVDGTLLALPIGNALNGYQPQRRIPETWAIEPYTEGDNYGF